MNTDKDKVKDKAAYIRKTTKRERAVDRAGKKDKLSRVCRMGGVCDIEKMVS